MEKMSAIRLLGKAFREMTELYLDGEELSKAIAGKELIPALQAAAYHYDAKGIPWRVVISDELQEMLCKECFPEYVLIFGIRHAEYFSDHGTADDVPNYFLLDLEEWYEQWKLDQQKLDW